MKNKKKIQQIKDKIVGKAIKEFETVPDLLTNWTIVYCKFAKQKHIFLCAKTYVNRFLYASWKSPLPFSRSQGCVFVARGELRAGFIELKYTLNPRLLYWAHMRMRNPMTYETDFSSSIHYICKFHMNRVLMKKISYDRPKYL